MLRGGAGSVRRTAQCRGPQGWRGISRRSGRGADICKALVWRCRAGSPVGVRDQDGRARPAAHRWSRESHGFPPRPSRSAHRRTPAVRGFQFPSVPGARGLPRPGSRHRPASRIRPADAAGRACSCSALRPPIVPFATEPLQVERGTVAVPTGLGHDAPDRMGLPTMARLMAPGPWAGMREWVCIPRVRGTARRSREET